MMMNTLRLLFLSCIICAATSAVSAFCPPTPPSASTFCPRPLARASIQSATIQLNLVTEADVIELVEKAEFLWEKVETLRKQANDLSIEAETLGQEAETSAADAMELLQASISEEKLETATEAQNLSINLGALLDQATWATKEANDIEALAEEALAASEAALEQHMIDFPSDDEIEVL